MTETDSKHCAMKLNNVLLHFARSTFRNLCSNIPLICCRAAGLKLFANNSWNGFNVAYNIQLSR